MIKIIKSLTILIKFILILYYLRITIMVSVFNVEPMNLNTWDSYEKYDYNFLNLLLTEYKISPQPYYDLLDSTEVFKLKNLYNFIFLRLIKINKNYDKINTIEKQTKNINEKDFNDFFKSYIKKDVIKLIVIINSIQLYYFPKLSD